MPDSRWDWDDCPYSPQAPFLDADDPQSLLVGDLPLDADSSRRQQEPPGRSCDPASLDFSPGPANFGGNNDQPCVEYGFPPGLEPQHPQQPHGASTFTAYLGLSEMDVSVPDSTTWNPSYPPQYPWPPPDPYLHSPGYSASPYYPSISPSQPSDGVPDEYATPMTPQDLSHHHGYDASTPEHKSQSKSRKRRRKSPEDLKYATTTCCAMSSNADQTPSLSEGIKIRSRGPRSAASVERAMRKRETWIDIW